ncbi:MAG TPA: FecR domain-containing protein [Prolixibacteraceae bacterium]|nr:FecR domain-containing protein [Prolixibacteraceae bacterium]
MKTNQHIEDKDWELLARSVYDKDSGISANELKDAKNAVFSSESESEQLHQLVQKVDLYFELNNYQVNEAWAKVENQIHSQSKQNDRGIRKLFEGSAFRAIAAVFVGLMLVVSGYFVAHKSNIGDSFVEVKSTDKVVNMIGLPDGTFVSLNTNTRITYPKKFVGNLREVSIEGEAFFEVKPDKNKPFVIHAGKAQIKVLGTSFCVNAYPEAKQVEVIVQTGKVQVLNKAAEPAQTNELILVPGDKGTLVYASNSLQKTSNQDVNFIAWKTRNLIFKATSLNEVIRNLEKVYNVKISLADPRLNDLLLTAQFNDYPLDFILKVIENTFQLEVQGSNGQYVLKIRS